MTLIAAVLVDTIDAVLIRVRGSEADEVDASVAVVVVLRLKSGC